MRVEDNQHLIRNFLEMNNNPFKKTKVSSNTMPLKKKSKNAKSQRKYYPVYS